MRRLSPALVATLLVATLLVPNPTGAHHSPAQFDQTAQLTVQGKVTRLDWTNPHVYIYVETRGANGETAQWMIETDPTPILTRSGWRRDSVRIGATVTVRAHPDRDTRRNHALLISLSRGDGVVLVPRAPTSPGAVRATSMAGVWNSLRGFAQRRAGPVMPTAKGLAARKASGIEPVASCIPLASPGLVTLPYLNEIEIRGDRIVIRSEFFNVDRTVYMDGRGHPTGGMRTRQGHSIGRWEGDVLVVDTTLFADHPSAYTSGPAQGLPSGSRKHVVERYRLSDDRTRLLIDFVVEDPEYLAEPFTMNMEWDYAPQQRLLRFGCDPAQARRFTFQ